MNAKGILTLVLLLTLNGCASLFGEVQDTEAGPSSRRYGLQRAPDIAYGMPMREVVSTWGDPAIVQEAGDNGELNQRWTYPGDQSKRVLYFENGQLVGWETVTR